LATVNKTTIIVIMLLTLHMTGICQNVHAPDSLTNTFRMQADDTAKVSLAIKIAQDYMLIDPDSAINYAQKGLTLSEKLDDIRGKAACMHLLGTAYTMKDNYVTGLKYIYASLDLKQQLNDEKGIAAGKITLGNIYKNALELSKAMNVFKEAADIFVKLHDTINYGVSLNCMANVYVDQDSLKQALAYFLKASDIAKRYKNVYSIANANLNMAIVYNKLGDREKARQFAESGLKLSSEMHYAEGEAGCKIVLARVASSRSEYPQAIKFAKDALDISQTLESYYDVYRSSAILYECYKKTGDYRNSLKYLEVSSSANDSIMCLDKAEGLSRMQLNNEIRHRENEILELNQKSHEKNLALIILAFVIAVGLIISYVIFRSRQKERKVNQLLLLQTDANVKQNAELLKQKEFIEKQNIEIAEKNELLTRSNEELQALDEQRNKILGRVAHDMRSPLGTICGLVEVITSEIEEKNYDEVKKFLAYIENISRSSLQLANDLLDISVIASGKLVLQKSSVAYSELLRETADYYNIRGVKKNIRINLNLPEEELGALCDPNKTKQVLNNLLDNAIKYSEPDTSVELSAKLEGGFIKTEVTDAGVGIPEEDIEKLFKEFSVTSVKSTGNEKSSGLGLAICKKIVETQGGQIGVCSKQGKGSTFYFTIPV
jgi:signal transduction histidine kinase